MTPLIHNFRSKVSCTCNRIAEPRHLLSFMRIAEEMMAVITVIKPRNYMITIDTIDRLVTEINNV